MYISGAVTFVIVVINTVFVFGQFTDSADDDENIRQNIIKYLLYNSRRIHDHAHGAKTDNPFLTQMLDYPRSLSAEKIKKSHLYGLNRPITLRQTRLASFGTILRPDNGNDVGTKNILRYG